MKLNIEQIKEDWIKHFKETTKDKYPNPVSYYIKEEWYSPNEKLIYLSWKNFDKDNYICISDLTDEICEIQIKTGFYKFYKLFSTFYEKLMGEIGDE